MSIKKKIHQVVAEDWQERQLHTNNLPPSPNLRPSPQQELKELQLRIANDDKRVATPAYLTASIIDALKFIAKHKGTSVASLIRQVLVEYIKKVDI